MKNNLPISQAAEYLGISVSTLRRWEKEGRLFSNRTKGNQRRFKLSQLNLVKTFVERRNPSDQKLDALMGKLEAIEARLAAVPPAVPSVVEEHAVPLKQPSIVSKLTTNSLTTNYLKHSHPAFSAILVSLLLLLLLAGGAAGFYFVKPGGFKSSILTPLSSFLLSGGARVEGTMRFLSTIFFGSTDQWYITPAGDASFRNLTASSGSFSSLTTNQLTTNHLTASQVINSTTMNSTNGNFTNVSTQNLEVTNQATISQESVSASSIGNLTVGGNETVGGTLGVTGAASLSSLSTSGLATLDSLFVSNNETVGGTINGNTLTSSALTFGGTNPAISPSTTNTSLSLDANGTGTVNIAGSSTGNVNLAGGSASSGCTIDNSTGNLTCSGNVTGGSTGTQGYWARTGTTLSPTNAGDNVTTSGNISTTSTGTITSASLLTASSGLTLTTGALNLTSTSGNVDLSGSAGLFKTSTGQNTLSGNTTLSLGKTFTFTSGAIDTSGNLGAGTASPGAKLEVDTGGTTQIGQIIKAQASQTADLLQIQNSLAGVIAKIDNLGNLTANSLTSAGNVSGTTLTSTVATGTAPLTVSSTTLVPNLHVQAADQPQPNLVLNSDFGRRNKWMTFMPETFADTSGWTLVDGTSLGSVASNILTAGNAGSWSARAGLSTWRDVRISAQWKAVDPPANSVTQGEAGRWQDANNQVRAFFNANTFYLWQTSTGTITSTAYTATQNNWYWTEIEIQGTTAIAKLYSSGASPVAKSSATLVATLSGSFSGSGTAGYAWILSGTAAASQWGGLSTGDGGVYVEGWGPESWPVTFQGTLGGQAVGFDESTDAGPLGRQSALRFYIPATNRGIYIRVPTGGDKPVLPSTSYISSAYILTSGKGGTGPLFILQTNEYDVNKSFINGTQHVIQDAGETSWTRKDTGAFTTQSTARYTDSGVAAGSAQGANSATGTGEIDLIQEEQGSVATPWRNAPADDGPITWNLYYNPITGNNVNPVVTAGAGFVEVDARDLSGNLFFPWDAGVRLDFSGSWASFAATGHGFLDFYKDSATVIPNSATWSYQVQEDFTTDNTHYFPVATNAITTAAAGKHRIALMGKATTANLGFGCGQNAYGNGVMCKFTVTATRGKYDLAEEYSIADKTIEAGDVVRLAKSDKQEAISSTLVEKVSQGYDPAILGIISTAPGVTLSSTVELNSYQEKPNLRPLALSGRVPVKVTMENGVIHRGDFLTSSAKYPGYAMKATAAGRTIGIALEDFTCASADKVRPCQGKILVFVNLSWWDPQAYITDSGQFVINKVASSESPVDSQGTVNSQEQTANGSEKAQAAQPAGSSPQTPVVSQPQTTNSEPSPAGSSASAPSTTNNYQLLNTQTKEVIERVGAYSSLFVADLTVGKLDVSEITLGGKNLADLLAKTRIDADGSAAQTNAEETVAVKDGQLTLTKITADSGIFQTIQATVSAAFEKLTVKTAEVALAITQNLTVKENLTLNSGVRGINVALETGVQNLVVKLDPTQADAAYAVSVSPSWLTSYSVTAKTTDSFTISFSTPAPSGATLDWIVVR